MTRPGSNNVKEREIELLRVLAHNPTRNVARGLALLLLLFIVPLLAAGFWIYQQAERELEQAEMARDLLRARTLGAVVEREFFSAQRLLISITDRKLFRRAWA